MQRLVLKTFSDIIKLWCFAPASQLLGQPSHGYFKQATKTQARKARGQLYDSADSSEASKKVRATAPATQNLLYPRFAKMKVW